MSSTEVPVAFEISFAARFADAIRAEQTVHRLFREYRYNDNREFFAIPPEKAVLALSMASIEGYEDVTPSTEEGYKQVGEGTVQETPAKRPNIRLSAIEVKPGAVLDFSRDDSIKATVVDNNKVEFEGQILSLPRAASEALRRLGYGSPDNVNGSRYWMIDDELLDARRRRLEGERFDEDTA